MPSPIENKNNYYERHGLKPPTSEPHGTEEEISRQLKANKKHKWFQQGNFLKCHCMGADTEHGMPIPVDMILEGVDKQGQPILRKLDLSGKVEA